MEQHRENLGLHSPLSDTESAGGALAKIKVKKRRKFRPGTVAYREIKQMQLSVDACIPAAPFKKLVKEIVREQTQEELRIKPEAIAALRSISEDYLVKKFEDAQLLAIHANRTTVQTDDLRRVGTLRKESFI